MSSLDLLNDKIQNTLCEENKITCVDGQLFKEGQWVHEHKTDKKLICFPEDI